MQPRRNGPVSADKWTEHTSHGAPQTRLATWRCRRRGPPNATGKCLLPQNVDSLVQRGTDFHLSRLLCIPFTAVLHRLLLLLVLSRCLFRLFRVSFRSFLISVTPQLLIVVFLARAPECLVPKSCCLLCPHLVLVSFQSNLHISV